jgi:hypothetical protein
MRRRTALRISHRSGMAFSVLGWSDVFHPGLVRFDACGLGLAANRV